MNRRIWAIVLCIAMSIFALTACGGGSSESEAPADEAATEEESAGGGLADMKIVLILPGSIDDQSWNASNYAGAQAADAELGTKIEVVESVPVEEFESTFTEYGEKGYNIVMSAGSQFDEAAAAVAPNYPNTFYCVINGQKSEADNMVPVFPKEYEGSYVAGILAGYATENGQFATMGGESNVPMVHLLDTYEKAAIDTAAARGIEGGKATRSFINSWTDVSLTKSTTDQMLDNGADVAFCYSNEGTSGAIQSCADKGAKFVGFAANKNSESDCVYGSVNMAWANVYPWIVNGIASGELKGAQEVGLAEGVFEMCYRDDTPQEVKDACQKAWDSVVNGEVDLTSYFSE